MRSGLITKTYTFDFDFHIVTPSFVGGTGALFAYVDFHVGGVRT